MPLSIFFIIGKSLTSKSAAPISDRIGCLPTGPALSRTISRVPRSVDFNTHDQTESLLTQTEESFLLSRRDHVRGQRRRSISHRCGQTPRDEDLKLVEHLGCAWSSSVVESVVAVKAPTTPA